MREVNPQKSEYKMFYERNKKWLVPTFVIAIVVALFVILMPVYVLQETQSAVVSGSTSFMSGFMTNGTVKCSHDFCLTESVLSR